VAIARDIRRVTPEKAKEAVLGWTCANDVTERAQQERQAVVAAKATIPSPWPGPSWRRSPEPGGLGTHPGERRSAAGGQILDMIRDPYTIISIVSQAMTLNRGDLIMLGTPSGWGSFAR